MKTAIWVTILTILSISPQKSKAQNDSIYSPSYGYLSYNAIYLAMPEYEEAKRQLEDLKNQYVKEGERAQEEFERKFTEYLHNVKNFPDNIARKRQYELETLMEENMAMKQDADELLKQAEEELETQIIIVIDEAIRAVGMEQRLDFIFNTDGKTAPFIHPYKAIDVTDMVKEKLGISVKSE